MKIAVNGFGRIGRNFVRAVLLDAGARNQVTIQVINIGPAKKEYIAHMFKYDTLMGTYPGTVAYEDDYLVIDGYRIKIIAHSTLDTNLWQQWSIEWVVDCTGHFTKRDQAQKHIAAGAKKVLISAPAHEEDIAIIMGVNHAHFDPKKHAIVSLGSCTTNAFIPLVQVMHDTFGIVNGFMKTVHAYTNTQVLLDVEAKDLRSSRAAALNIIPTTTGASSMIDKIVPQLTGKIACVSLRVPIGKVSLLDFSFVADKPISVEAMHAACIQASQTYLAGIMALTMEPLVSSDFSGNSHSVVVDGLLTQVVGNNANIFGWYDNEWAYSVRIKDFLLNQPRH